MSSSDNSDALNDPLLESPTNRREKSQVESLEDMQYIKNNVEPIFNTMMVKIINEEPKDVMSFILNHLRQLKQQRDYQNKLKQKPK